MHSNSQRTYLTFDLRYFKALVLDTHTYVSTRIYICVKVQARILLYGQTMLNCRYLCHIIYVYECRESCYEDAHSKRSIVEPSILLSIQIGILVLMQCHYHIHMYSSFCGTSCWVEKLSRQIINIRIFNFSLYESLRHKHFQRYRAIGADKKMFYIRKNVCNFYLTPISFLNLPASNRIWIATIVSISSNSLTCCYAVCHTAALKFYQHWYQSVFIKVFLSNAVTCKCFAGSQSAVWAAIKSLFTDYY